MVEAILDAAVSYVEFMEEHLGALGIVLAMLTTGVPVGILATAVILGFVGWAVGV